MELLRVQTELEHRFGVACFVDMSVTETLYNLVALGATQTANSVALQQDAIRVQRRFRVPEGRFAHVKVKALAASGQWDALRAFAAEKKSPVGYRPFVNACVAHGQPASETAKYVERLPNADEKFVLLVQLELWRAAADAAFKLKDAAKLQQVQRACDNPQLANQIDEYIARI